MRSAPATGLGLLPNGRGSARAREVLRFDYAGRRSGDDAEPRPPRRVEPHHLVTSHGRWYLVAWDLDRGDWRIFSAGRITPRTPTGPRFPPREVPGADVAEYVSARFKGSDRDNRWPCRGKVVLHLPAHTVLPFAGDGTVEVLGWGRCILEAGSWSWIALAASLNRFDIDIEVVGPPELSRVSVHSRCGTLRRRPRGAVSMRPDCSAGRSERPPSRCPTGAGAS